MSKPWYRPGGQKTACGVRSLRPPLHEFQELNLACVSTPSPTEPSSWPGF